VSSTYDAQDQRIALADPVAGSVTTYDPGHNYAVDAIYRATANGREHQSLYSYDASHRLIGISFQTCTADSTHACSDTPVATGSDAYFYDANDNRTQVIESNGAASTDRRYCYDAQNQLASAKSGSACSPSAYDQAWTYDASGNRLTAISGGTTTNYAYHSDGRLCDVETSAAANCTSGNVAADSSGRIQSWNGWTFGYDAEGRLVTACRSASCAAGHDRLSFTYDGEGHRTAIVAVAASGTVTTTEFRYQGDAVVEEKQNGDVVRQFVTDEAGAISKLIIPAGRPDAGTYLVTWTGHGDALNLLRVNADGSTTLANSVQYDSWGTPTVATHNGIGDLGFRYLYVGQFDVQWDNQFGLGLHYMHARHYAPALGRFLQPDPAGEEANAYAYVGNGPISRIDPSGTIAWCAIPFIGWAVCATGIRIVAWVGTTAISWVGSLVIRAGPAATTFSGRAPQTVNVIRDWAGRVSSASATITRATVRTGTSTTQAARTWCCNGSDIYQAGHLIARVLGGPGGLRSGNVIPILNTLNNSAYKMLELRILRWAEAGNQVQVWVQPVYANGSTHIPAQINYWYRVNGGPWMVQIFRNR
jgi:RHS repeat-associated protein